MSGGAPVLRLPGLADRLRARYPLIGVVAADERDGVTQVQLAAAAVGLACRLLRFGRGDAVTQTLDALEALIGQRERQEADLPACETVLIACGGAQLLDHPLAAQLLGERLVDLERAGATLVLVGPSLRPPPSLARDLVALHLPLPSRAELEPLVLAALTTLQGPPPPEELEAAVQALQGLTLAQARRALRRVRERPAGGTLPELRAEKRDLLASSGTVEVVEQIPALGDIGGLDELKAWLERQRLALTQEARRYGLPLPRGVLLVGVQGCGKTLTAKAAAAVLGLPLLRLDLSLLHTAHHSPDENLRQALAVAEAMAPVVLWIDEMDKAFGTAGTAGGASEAGARVFGSLLTWLGEQRRGVFVAATANRLTHLPAELLRKGRFDETFFVDVPDQQARAEILAAALTRSGRNAMAFELERLALASDRLTGAEIDQAVSEALQVAFCAHRELRSADIEAVLSKIVPFVETYDSQVRELRQWARRHCRPASRDRSLHELFAAARGSATSPPRPGQR